MLRLPRLNKKLSDIIDSLKGHKLISVELSPYKPIDYNILSKIDPSFCSVTWIAKANDPKDPKLLPPIIVAKELVEKGFVVLIHVPGIFYTKQHMRNILNILKKIGIRNIFAMRGGGPWLKREHCDFPFAQEFIEFIRNEYGDYFEIVIAGFPHVHPATRSMEDEMFFLKQKVLGGASMICTQACMSPEWYLNYRRMCTDFAIDIPIIFGLLIFRSFNDFVRIKRMSKSIDSKVYKRAIQAKKADRSKEFGRIWTRYVIEELLKDEFTVGIHIFTQNVFEYLKNILNETNAYKYKANLKKIQKFS